MHKQAAMFVYWSTEQGSSDTTIIKGCLVSQLVCLKTLTSKWPWMPSIGQHFKPFTADGAVSIWVKNPKQTRKYINTFPEILQYSFNNLNKSYINSYFFYMFIYQIILSKLLLIKKELFRENI